MKTVRDQVLEFHEMVGQPIVETPQVPSDERVRSAGANDSGGMYRNVGSDVRL